MACYTILIGIIIFVHLRQGMLLFGNSCEKESNLKERKKERKKEEEEEEKEEEEEAEEEKNKQTTLTNTLSTNYSLRNITY